MINATVDDYIINGSLFLQGPKFESLWITSDANGRGIVYIEGTLRLDCVRHGHFWFSKLLSILILYAGDLTLTAGLEKGEGAMLRISTRANPLQIGGCLNADASSFLALLVPSSTILRDGVCVL